jgi:hypothetical protein
MQAADFEDHKENISRQEKGYKLSDLKATLDDKNARLFSLLFR